MDMHEGHRQRLKQRFAEHGLDNFNDVNVLELLLFYALPRGDTNPVAHALLERFGSLWAVFDAPTEELARVKGVGHGAAMLLKLIPQISRRYIMSFEQSVRTFSSTSELGRYCVPLFLYQRDEELYMLCLDDMNRLIRCVKLFNGVPNAAEISIRKIAEVALNANATRVVLTHNHPDGVALPSQADRTLTENVEQALAPLGIRLLDHIIVGGNDFVSLREDQLYNR